VPLRYLKSEFEELEMHQGQGTVEGNQSLGIQCIEGALDDLAQPARRVRHHRYDVPGQARHAPSDHVVEQRRGLGGDMGAMLRLGGALQNGDEVAAPLGSLRLRPGFDPGEASLDQPHIADTGHLVLADQVGF
jgi:hypothetical protein